MNKEIKLEEFSSKEEADKVVAELDAVLTKNQAHLLISPIINKDGTLGASARVLKKVEIEVPAKEEVKPEATA